MNMEGFCNGDYYIVHWTMEKKKQFGCEYLRQLNLCVPMSCTIFWSLKLLKNCVLIFLLSISISISFTQYQFFFEGFVASKTYFGMLTLINNGLRGAVESGMDNGMCSANWEQRPRSWIRSSGHRL